MQRNVLPWTGVSKLICSRGGSPSSPAQKPLWPVGIERPLVPVGRDQQQLVFPNDDTKVVKPGVIGAIVARIARPFRGNFELARTRIFFASVPVATIEQFRYCAVLTMKSQWK